MDIFSTKSIIEKISIIAIVQHQNNRAYTSKKFEMQLDRINRQDISVINLDAKTNNYIASRYGTQFVIFTFPTQNKLACDRPLVYIVWQEFNSW